MQGLEGMKCLNLNWGTMLKESDMGTCQKEFNWYMYLSSYGGAFELNLPEVYLWDK